VARTSAEEGPAYGAALLAGVACGTFSDVADACERVALLPELTEPDEARAAVYDELYGLYREAYPATAPLAHRLSG